MPKSLKKNSFITLLGQLTKTGFQGIAFIILARTLGATDFGVLISIIAIGSILSPFVDFGSYHLIIQRLSNSEKFNRVASETLILLLVSAPIFITFLAIITTALYGYSIYLVLCVGITVLFSDKLLSLFIAFNVARDRFKIVAVVESVVSALRAIFALLLLFLDGDVLTWAVLLLIHGLITTIIVYTLLSRIDHFSFSQKPSREMIKKGMPFVWSELSINANQDFDKLFLAKISGADIAGIYAAAMRVLNLALIPIYSFYMTAYPRFFKASSEGINGLKQALTMLLPSAFIGVITAIMIYFIAPFVPWILGDEYIDAIGLIQLAALIPIVQTMTMPFADTLSGYGKQTLRVYSLIAALILNIILNILLIPSYGAYGALVASLLSQSLFLIMCIGFTLRNLHWK